MYIKLKSICEMSKPNKRILESIEFSTCKLSYGEYTLSCDDGFQVTINERNVQEVIETLRPIIKRGSCAKKTKILLAGGDIKVRYVLENTTVYAEKIKDVYGVFIGGLSENLPIFYTDNLDSLRSCFSLMSLYSCDPLLTEFSAIPEVTKENERNKLFMYYLVSLFGYRNGLGSHYKNVFGSDYNKALRQFITIIDRDKRNNDIHPLILGAKHNTYVGKYKLYQSKGHSIGLNLEKCKRITGKNNRY